MRLTLWPVFTLTTVLWFLTVVFNQVSLSDPLNLLLSPLRRGTALKRERVVFVFDKGGHCVVASGWHAVMWVAAYVGSGICSHFTPITFPGMRCSSTVVGRINGIWQWWVMGWGINGIKGDGNLIFKKAKLIALWLWMIRRMGVNVAQLCGVNWWDKAEWMKKSFWVITLSMLP